MERLLGILLKKEHKEKEKGEKEKGEEKEKEGESKWLSFDFASEDYLLLFPFDFVMLVHLISIININNGIKNIKKKCQD